VGIILEVRNISKRFPGCKALDDVSIHLNEGELLSVVGENGAGKSTLMKILAGVYNRDSGEIILNGKPVDIKAPRDALDLGISLIHQELSVAPDITVAENLFMGREPLKHGFFIDRKKLISESNRILDMVEAPFRAHQYPREFSIAEQQLMEIAKAVGQNSRILIMDEPTASLSQHEMESLFKLIERLKKKNISIIYISHRLKEVVDISDRVAVLRDGSLVATLEKHEINENDIVKHMVGRTLSDFYGQAKNSTSDDVVLSVRNLSDDTFIKDVSFNLYKGEILALTGLVGAGRTEIAQMLFGLDKRVSGDIYKRGEKLEIASPIDAMRNQIGFLSEDRKGSGLFIEMSAADNISFNVLRKIASYGFLGRDTTEDFSKQYINSMQIRLSSPKVKALSLSGGNQQKLLLSRWLSIKPEILILDEPTRGVDVGAKSEIYKIIFDLVADGKTSVIFISSELPEVIWLANRVLVVRDGSIVGEIKEKSQITQDHIMQYATGVKKPDYHFTDNGTV
jgi:ribose transport system ATP-binding protein